MKDQKTNIFTVEDIPLSENQKQLWFIQRKEPWSHVYNIPGAYCIRGKLSIELFKNCINEFVETHHVFRTCFSEKNGEPIAYLESTISMNVSIENISNQSDDLESKKNDAINILREEARVPFDLRKAPLCRCKLIIISDDTSILGWTMHHIISDGWSMKNIGKELLKIYKKRYNETEIVERGNSFDFLIPENNVDTKMIEEQQDKQIQYWENKLQDYPKILKFPGERKRNNSSSLNGDYVLKKIDTNSYHKLKKVSRVLGASMFQLVSATFQVLINHYTNMDKFILGFLYSNRNSMNQDEIGYYVNTVPWPIQIDINKKFSDFLITTVEHLYDSISNGEVSFAKLLNSITVKRNQRYSPLVQIMCIQQTPFTCYLDELDIEMEYMVIDHEKGKFDLALYIEEHLEKDLTIWIEYKTDLFSSKYVEAVINSLCYLLQQIMKNPDIHIKELNLLTPEQMEEIVYGWNQTEKQYEYKNLTELLNRQVLNTPDALALVVDNKCVNYQELNDKAELLAHHMVSVGLRPKLLVGVLFERSEEMVIALIATLKCGCAFVPLNPDYPMERLQKMIEVANISCLLSHKNLWKDLCLRDLIKICLDDDWEDIRNTVPISLPKEIEKDDIAYVIFTSGTTGIPKGVMNTHRGICNRLLWMQDEMKLNSNDRILQKTPFSFDVSLWEFFLPLITGATLVIAEPDAHRDPWKIIQYVISEKITTIHFVPSMLKLFLQTNGVEKCNKFLRRVVCSGEEMTKALQKDFFDIFESSLYNLYGPTEAAIDVTMWQCSAHCTLDKVPIGQPINNTQIYILNSALHPVPPLVEGDLYISGDNLAKGYVNNVELTQEKFISNPFIDGKKMYYTGDRAVYLPDGNIVFCGRIDNQVKINGQRIELDEIDAHIRKIQGVKDCIVVAEKNETEHLILSAYVICDTSHSLEYIRNYLGSYLPSYAIPQYFNFVKNIPLSINGKIDYKQLKKCGVIETWKEDYMSEALSKTEEILTQIWKDVLKIKEVSKYDNYFNLGGDSIRSISIIHQAKEKGLQLEVADLFKQPSIFSLAKLADEKVKNRTNKICNLVNNQVNSQNSDREDTFPMSSIQLGLVYHSEHDNYVSYITSYRVKAQYSTEWLLNSINKISDRHPILRTCFEIDSGQEAVQHVYRTVQIPFQEYDWTNETFKEEKLRKWFEEVKKLKREWTSPSLFNFYVHKFDENEFQFTISEPVLDGWSVTILAADIFKMYINCIRKEEIYTFERLKCTYKDFVMLENKTVQSKEHREFWQEELVESAPTILTRWPHDKNKKSNLCRKRTDVSRHLYQKLHTISQKLNVPIKSVLLSAYVHFIFMLTGKNDITTGVLMNGRPEMQDGEKVVGNFLNTIPLRVKRVKQSWEKLIKQIYDREVEIMPHRRYPFALIQKENKMLNFDTIFNYVRFYPYEEFRQKDFTLLDIHANDQTYFPLTVQFVEDWRSGELVLSMDYDESEFNENQIDYMTQYLIKTLDSIATKPEGDSSVWQWKQDELQESVCVKGESSSSDFSMEQNFIDIFEEEVEKSAERIAVTDERGQCTYSQLNNLVERVVSKLLKNGYIYQKIVVVIAEPSIEFLASIIAILKVGAIYLPINLQWPVERVSQVIRTSEADYVIIASKYMTKYESIIRNVKSIISLEECVCSTECSGRNEKANVLGEDVAYIMFTSGSTGEPKGAMITHKGMLNHLQAKIRALNIGKNSVVGQTASQSFDISIWQFLAALMVGGKVAIAPSEIIFEPIMLTEFLYRNKVTIYEVVPALLNTIMNEIDRGRILHRVFDSLKWLIVTGESFSYDLCIKWFERYANIPIVNAYGPTECSDDVTHKVLYEKPSLHTNTIPIGQPIPNVKLFVLNESMEFIPCGVPGELYVGGISVGLGYVNNLEQTKEAFIYVDDKIFGTDILYKTGDLVRLLPDGDLEFLERVDKQVKIRGNRVELGEIEYWLRKYNGVNNAIAILDDSIISVYIVVDANNIVDLCELKRYLQSKIPAYMMPQNFYAINALPYTDNGKIDRNKLQRQAKRLSISTQRKEANTKYEIEMLNIWKEVLGSDDIGVQEDFFDIGGHSIKAIQLVSIISRHFGKLVTIQMLKENSSIEKMALLISDLSKNSITNKKKNESNLYTLPYQRLEGISLDKVVESSNIEEVDAASFGYLPDSVLDEMGCCKKDIIEKCLMNCPVVRRIFTTQYGKIAHILLPMFTSDIYVDKNNLLDNIYRGVKLAERLQVKTISLTGILPSATNYGKDVLDNWPEELSDISITTGHSITVATVVMSINNILDLCERNIECETVGFVGLGSIGYSTLMTMLQVMPHPRSIVLCDVFEKKEELQEIKSQIENTLLYEGEIIIVNARPEIEDAFYNSTLIIGASSVPNVLDIDKLHEFTLIVDDSAPHCFNVDKAFERMKIQKDILFTEAGILHSPTYISEDIYMPNINESINVFNKLVQYRPTEYDIMGCLFSSILCKKGGFSGCEIGLPDINNCIKHYRKLSDLGYTSSKLNCRDSCLEQDDIKKFKENQRKKGK